MATKTANNYSNLSPEAQKWENRLPKPYFSLSTEDKQAISKEAKARIDNTSYKVVATRTTTGRRTITFRDSNGKTHTFTANNSINLNGNGYRQDKADIDNLQEQLKKAGFTNVTITPQGY